MGKLTGKDSIDYGRMCRALAKEDRSRIRTPRRELNAYGYLPMRLKAGEMSWAARTSLYCR